MPSGSKFLLILVFLIIFGGIGFYVLIPHYMKTNLSPEEQAIARTLDDVERAQKLVSMTASARRRQAPTDAWTSTGRCWLP